MSLDPHWTLSFSGDFWKADIKKTLYENTRLMMLALAKEGEQDVTDHFPVGGLGDPHPGLGQTGVVGRVQSMSGNSWGSYAVISQQHVYPWGQRSASLSVTSGRGKTKSTRQVSTSGNEQYRGGKLEAKLHMFRNTASRISSMRSILSADLTKGFGD